MTSTTLTRVGRSSASSARPRERWYTILVLPLIVIVIWQIASMLASSAVFPAPWEALQGLWADLGRESYRANILVTVRLVLSGLAISVVFGGLFGFLVGQSRFWSAVSTTPLSVLFALPLVTLYPVFILFFGIGEASQLAFAVAHSIFPMAMIVMVAVGAIDPLLTKLASALRLSTFTRLTKIVIPSVLPSFVTALRVSYSLTFLGLILAGMISSTSGLGHELVLNIANARLDRIMGQVIMIVLLAVVPGLALRSLEKRMERTRA